MARIKRGLNRIKKKFFLAKSYRGRSKNFFRIALQRVEKALRYAYRDRKTKKHDMRALLIQRINAAVREHGLVYLRFIDGLIKADIKIYRKNLADIAVQNSTLFSSIVEKVKVVLNESYKNNNLVRLEFQIISSV